MIVNNSTIKSLVNKSRELSSVPLNIPLPGTRDIRECEAVIRAALEKLPAKFPEIVGEPLYLGVLEFPQKNPFSGRVQGGTACATFSCLEQDRGLLTLKVYQELMNTVQELLQDPEGSP